MKTKTLSLIYNYFRSSQKTVRVRAEGKRRILEGELAVLVVERAPRGEYSVVSYGRKQ